MSSTRRRRGIADRVCLLLACVGTTASHAGPVGEPELVKDINPGRGTVEAASSDHDRRDTFYFRADDGLTGSELWKSKGTAATTRLVKDVWPGQYGSKPHLITAIGNTMYFEAYGSKGSELWRTEGTRASTRLVKDIYPGAGQLVA